MFKRPRAHNIQLYLILNSYEVSTKQQSESYVDPMRIQTMVKTTTFLIMEKLMFSIFNVYH